MATSLTRGLERSCKKVWLVFRLIQSKFDSKDASVHHLEDLASVESLKVSVLRVMGTAVARAFTVRRACLGISIQKLITSYRICSINSMYRYSVLC